MNPLVRVLIVDDHPLVRRGLGNLLRLEQDIDVVGEAEDGAKALSLASALDPDVVLMDYSMPGMNGADTTRALLARQRDAAVIGVSNDDEPHVRKAMKEAGASDFFIKGDNHSTLLAMIHRYAAVSGSSSDEGSGAL